VRTQRVVGRRVSRQDRLVASAEDAWARRSLGGEEGSRVLGLRDGVVTLAVLNFGATRYAPLTPRRPIPSFTIIYTESN
jgi:hypothetical protein